ncbi:MAG TPA: amino acid adenylation domain-containing protein, partial [Nitrospira sp.]|nr:amino acid adenylation domain-containing protein [Nitrospira sp.]
DAYAHQDLPFEQVVEALKVSRHMSYSPLFQVMLTMIDTPQDEELALPGLVLSRVDTPTNTAQHDLSLYINETSTCITGNLVFATALFEGTTVERMVRRFETILESFVQDPQVRIGDLDIDQDLSLPNILPVSISAARLPLSYHQERLWFIDTFEAGNLYEASPIYHNIPLVLDLTGAVETSVIENAINTIIARHEALRVRLMMDGADVWQVVDSTAPLTLGEVSADADTVRERVIKETRIPFKLIGDRLIRATLFRIHDQRALLAITIHHMVADRTSMQVITEELLELCAAKLESREPVLPHAPIQYSDYTYWQRHLPARVRESLLGYWKYQLHGRLQAIELPINRPRPAVHTFTEACHEIAIEAPVVQRLTAFAKQEGLTPFDLVFAGLNALLRRYTGHEELVVGTSVPCRNQPAICSVVGPISNLLVLRTFCNDRTSFQALCAQGHRKTEQAFRYQEMQFDQLVLALKPEKDMSRTALFDVLCQFDGKGGKPLSAGALQASVIETNLGYGKYDLHLYVHPDRDQWVGKLVYNADIFDAWLIEQMMRHYVVLLEALAADPSQLIDDVPLLSDKEVRQQLIDWNQSDANYPTEKTIHQLFEEQVERTPDHIAISILDSHLTYRELNERANRLAHHLRELGTAQEELVALCLDRSLEMIVAMLGAIKAGVAYVPIDPTYPSERIHYILRDCQARFVITTKQLASVLSPLEPTAIFMSETSAAFKAYSASNPVNISEPHHLIYVIYTSGSTGRPKGTLLEHRNVVRLLVNDRMPFTFGATDVWSMFHSYAFDFSVWEIYGALLYGGRVVIVPDHVRQDPSAFLDLVIREGVTVLSQTPSAFYNLMGETAKRSGLQVPALRYIVFGGESLDPINLKDFYHAYPAIQLINMYGITETCVHVTFKQVTASDITGNSSNIGRPIPTTTTYIMDAKQRLLPAGVPGEVCVGGRGVGRGYLNREELTRTRFVTNPYEPTERLYRSGDLAKLLEDGELIYLGRMDDQVQLRGFRIELGEIEAQLVA